MSDIVISAQSPSGGTGAYATPADLAGYLRSGTAPSDAARLLARASELIDEAVMPNQIDLDNTEHVAAASKATCLQVEWWLEEGEQRDTHGPVSQLTASKTQEVMGRSAPTYLAPRARRVLLLAGLLYRGCSERRGIYGCS